jgi:cellulose biosynthesis protein BcsQ
VNERPDAPGALRQRGFVYTFYSFKGGVGRSMALANVAALLSRWGRSVLVIDWDLEAPGIEKYFSRWLEGSRAQSPGLVEMVAGARDGSGPSWRDGLLQAHVPQGKPIAILHAGREDADYSTRLRAIDWEAMFARHDFGQVLERWRNEWIEAYDFVLVDSRTGITDIGGICTIHLPDVLVSLFTTNEQSLAGVKDVMQRARRAHAQLPLPRKRLIVVPTPARDESSSEFQLAAQWRSRFAAELESFYADWIPKDETPLRVLDLLKIPYLPYWSFGERLPVLEEDADNPKTLSYSYQLLARLILSRLDLRELRGGQQASEALTTQIVAVELGRIEAAATREKAQIEAAERERQRQEEHARQRAQAAREFLDGVWQPAVAAYRRVALALLVAGAVCLLLALVPMGLRTETYGATQWAYVPWQALWYELGYSGRSWVGVGLAVYAAFGAWLLWRGWRRWREATAARHERTLYEQRALGFAELDADAGLRLLVFNTQHLLGPGFRWPAGNEPAAAAARPPQAPQAATPDDPFAAPDLPRTVVRPPAAAAPHATPAAASPAVPAAPAGPIDVYISYRHSTITRQWLREFTPLFSSWLTEALGRPAIVFLDEEQAQAGDRWIESLRDAASRSRCFLALLTNTYFAYEFTRSEWDAACRERASTVVPLWFQGELTQFPPEAQSLQMHDFRAFSYIGEGFTRSDKYVEFQQRVQFLATEIARVLPNLPVSAA